MPKKKKADNMVATAGPAFKPTTTFEVGTNCDLPKLGATVTCSVRGKVIRTEEGKDQYGPNPNRTMRSVTIQHGHNAAMVQGGKRSMEEMEEADESV